MILLLYPLAAVRMMGAGDGKLLGVIACYLGFFPALWILAAAGLLAALVSLCVKARRQFLGRRLSYLFRYLSLLARLKCVFPYGPPQAPEGRLPLAVPVFGGVLLYLFGKGVVGV